MAQEAGTTSWSTLRAAFATQIETVSGTVASRQPISVSNVPSTIGTIPYAIMLESSNKRDQSRNRPGRPARVDTVVVVTIARKLQVDTQVSSYDTALDNAANVIEACVAPDALTLRESHVFFDRMTSTVSSTGEWVVIALRFVAQHHLNLTASA